MSGRFLYYFLATSVTSGYNKFHYYFFILTILTTDVVCYVIDSASAKLLLIDPNEWIKLMLCPNSLTMYR